MSEVMTTSTSSRPVPYEVKVGRQASPDATRQAAKEGGKDLPPSASQETPKITSSTADTNVVEQVAEQVSAAVAQMNEYIQTTQRDLHFSIDKESGETIVKVLDRQTQEVIRQIPDDVFLKLAQNLSVNQPVHFFSEQA